MGRTAGSKDKAPRKRRHKTNAEKAQTARKKEKRKEEQRRQNRAKFLLAVSGDTAKEQDVEEETQDGPVYYEIPAEFNGTSDLGEIAATLEDNDESDDEGGEEEVAEDKDGVMFCYRRAIMQRFKTEASPKFDPKEEKWLHIFLREHGYWIRSECAQLICRKLDIPFVQQAYYRDIRVWFPDVEGGQNCMPCCPTCKKNQHVRPHSYPTDHPGRRVVTFDSHMYLMTLQYQRSRLSKLSPTSSTFVA